MNVARTNASSHAPAFQVRLAGSDVLYDEGLKVVALEVDAGLDGASRATVELHGSFDPERGAFDMSERLLEFGAALDIRLGHVDDGPMTLVFEGLTTAVSPCFPADDIPSLVITGHDYSYPMLLGARSRGWVDMTDADIVAQVAREHRLTARTSPTPIQYERVEQIEESDYAFVRRLALRNGFEFYVRGRDLHFQPAGRDRSADMRLTYGRNLLSFEARLSLAEQVTRVEVHGWNAAAKEVIRGRAGSPDIPGRVPGMRSGCEALESFTDEAALHISHPVRTPAEADLHAKALLKSRSERFVCATALARGIPDARPDTKVRVDRLGAGLDRDWFVERCIHRLGARGFSTQLHFSETSA